MTDRRDEGPASTALAADDAVQGLTPWVAEAMRIVVLRATLAVVKFADLYPLCLQLATTNGTISAAIDSVGLQVFEGSYLRHDDPAVLQAFVPIIDGSAVELDAIDFADLLGKFGRELFCFGSVVVVVDRSQDALAGRRTVFRLMNPTRPLPVEIPADLSVVLHTRDERLADDPTFGVPLLMPAVLDYAHSLGMFSADIDALQRVIDGEDSASAMKEHDALLAQRQRLDESVLTKAGFVRVPGDVAHVRREVAVKLAIETVDMFTRAILEPFAELVGSAGVPQVRVPLLTEADDRER